MLPFIPRINCTVLTRPWREINVRLGLPVLRMRLKGGFTIADTEISPTPKSPGISGADYFRMLLAMACQISSLISVAGGLAMMVTGPARL